MRQTKSTAVTQSEIIRNMKKTFEFRNNWMRNNKPDPEEILENYPKFLDFNGEIVSFFILILMVLSSYSCFHQQSISREYLMCPEFKDLSAQSERE